MPPPSSSTRGPQTPLPFHGFVPFHLNYALASYPCVSVPSTEGWREIGRRENQGNLFVREMRYPFLCSVMWSFDFNSCGDLCQKCHYLYRLFSIKQLDPLQFLLSGFVVWVQLLFSYLQLNLSLDMWGRDAPADILIIHFCANKASVVQIELHLKVPNVPGILTPAHGEQESS